MNKNHKITKTHRGPPGPGSGAASGTGALPGQGNHLLNRRTRGGGGGPSDEEGEFDFEAGLAKFDKEKVKELLIFTSYVFFMTTLNLSVDCCKDFCTVRRVVLFPS